MTKVKYTKQKSNGHFQIVDFFQVAGRDPVVCGNILDGMLKIGMVTQTTKGTSIKKPLALAAVDYIDNISTH